QIALGIAGYNIPTRETHFAQLHAYHDLGGNLVDTALVYGQWIDETRTSTSELVFGEWLGRGDNREKTVISTKGAHPHMGDPTPRVNPDCIREDVALSLSHLRVPSMDIYYLHRDDKNIPVSVIMDELNRHAEKGEINLLGASNWTAARIYEANDYCVQHHLRGFDVSQICFNILRITPEMIGDTTLICMTDEEYGIYQDMKMPIMSFTSQAGGYVSKFFDTPDSEVRSRYATPATHSRMNRIRVLCRDTGMTPTEVTLSYLLSQPLTVIPIIAASRPSQLEDCMTHSEKRLTPEQISWIDGN
ncbi:MAG: aldo/keto reductase, partial [Clostridia bacterium]|nr:aldo/keto reductase [Clostridia bacterium]